MLKIGVKQLLEAANAEIVTRSVEEVMKLYEDDNVVLVDIRDATELQRDGCIPGAVHASRGMLEFYVDPNTPRHMPVFVEDKEFVFY